MTDRNVLGGHAAPGTIAGRLRAIADRLGDEEPESYGQGEYLQAFEHHVAELFAKPAAVFMPSGTMAQQIALRIWSDRTARTTVAMHPSSHLEFAEHGGLQFLHGIQRLRWGAPEFIANRVLVPRDFEQLATRPAAALVELPYRPLGGVLPAWDDLIAIADWCRENEVRFHLDGARIWHCQPYYGKSLAEIGALFDSIYVSFYKDLGGLAGCMLIGEPDFIAEARVWQRRYGGNLFNISPLIAAARIGLDSFLPDVDAWVNRAREVAAEFAGVPGVIVNPSPPHVNFFNLYLPGDPVELLARHDALSESEGTVLFRRLRATEVPGYAATEIHVFENAMTFDLARLRPFMEALLLGN